MSEPKASILRALFGDQARAFAPPGLPTTHVFVEGDLRRLPEALRASPLASAGELAAVYQGRLMMAGGSGRDFRQLNVSGPSATDLLQMGLTAYFYDVLPTIPMLRPFLAQLGAELGIPPAAIRCAAWASPDEEGLLPHFDKYDGLIIQLEGEKLYRIGPNRDFENTVRQWSPGVPLEVLDTVLFKNGEQPTSPPDDLEEVLLTPGSALFLPRGYWHGTAARGLSFSVSIRFDPPTVVDAVLEELRLTLLQDPKWRRPLYGGWGTAAMQEAVCSLIDERLASLPAILSQITARGALANTSDAGSQFKHLSAKSRLCRDPNVVVTLLSDPSAPLRASIDDTTRRTIRDIRIPQAVGPLVTWLAARAGFFTIGDAEACVADADRKEVWTTLELLTRAGALKVVPAGVSASP